MQKRGYPILVRMLPALVVAMLSLSVASAKPKHKPQAADAPADSAADTDLPDNANLASLRVSAIDTIYEMDLSNEQLSAFSALASTAADPSTRSPGTASPQFITLLKSFQTALLEAKDDPEIAKLRNQVIDVADSADVHLDTDIVTTDAARARAAAACVQLKAGQIAAYLAVHAEEVSDPVELMMSTADSPQEMRADAQKSVDGGQETDSMIHETAASIGYLVGGADQSKAAGVSQQVAQWLRDSAKLNDAQFAAQRQALEASAKKIAGQTAPMQVLNNWMQDQIAILFSNPQFTSAAEVVLKCREQTN